MSVRKASTGIIARMVRKDRESDMAGAAERRVNAQAEKIAKETRKLQTRALKENQANETKLITTVKEIRAHIESYGGVKTHILQFLKGQFNARVHGTNLGTYPSIGMAYRSEKTKKLRMGPPKGKDAIEYLQELVELMVAADPSLPENNHEQSAPNVVEQLAVISAAHTSIRTLNFKSEHDGKLREFAKVEDDPLLVELLEKYKDKILYENDAKKPRTFQVTDVLYVQGSSQRPSCWEATCVEVIKTNGEWKAPPSAYVGNDPVCGVFKKSALEGFELVDLTDENIPVRKPWVDEYIAAHLARALQ